MESITITVYGDPGPQGSKSFKGFSKAGRAILTESSLKVAPWRQAVIYAAREAMMANPQMFPFKGAVQAEMTFTMKKPASAPKRRVTYPCVAPDADKLARSTNDALTIAGVWVDDAQVVDLRSRKVYPGEGRDSLATLGAVIRVRRITVEEVVGETDLLWKESLYREAEREGGAAVQVRSL